jgi:fatty-acyl-CoA synthase
MSVIRGGENVYPREIEEFLFTHPAVQEVQVFGVPDGNSASRSARGSSCAPATRSARRKCALSAGTASAHFKVPRYVRFVDTIPMTVTGKPQKFKMREEMERILAGDSLSP